MKEHAWKKLKQGVSTDICTDVFADILKKYFEEGGLLCVSWIGKNAG